MRAGTFFTNFQIEKNQLCSRSILTLDIIKQLLRTLLNLDFHLKFNKFLIQFYIINSKLIISTSYYFFILVTIMYLKLILIITISIRIKKEIIYFRIFIHQNINCQLSVIIE